VNLAALSVRNWQFTLIAFAFLATLGISAFLTIPRAEDPSFNAPFFYVTIVAPGMEARDVEQLIIRPIEDGLNELEDIDEIRATAEPGAANVNIQFSWNADPERKYDDLVREINVLQGQLPAGITELTVRKGEPGLTDIVQIALVGDVPYRTLYEAADELADHIKRAHGVRQSEVWGAPTPEMRVSLDLGRMAALGVTADAVSTAIAGANQALPNGGIDVGTRQFIVKSTGVFKNAARLEDVPIVSSNGTIVRVRDIARVGWSTEEPNYIARYNGRRAVFVTANMRDGENIFGVRNNILAIVRDYTPSLPEGVTAQTGFDQSHNVERSLSRLQSDFVLAIFLVLVTLIPLGVRAAIVVMISIPLSLLIALACLNGLGYSLNQLSIAGFVLALGLLVDDSIVVVENISRHLREGKTPLEAAIAGVSQIGSAVFGCTATLLLAFLPLLFLPEGSGAFIRSLPVSVLLAVSASLFVSLTIIPFLSSRILAPEDNVEGNIVLRGVMGFVHAVYRPLLKRALFHPRATALIALGIFVATMALVPFVGFSLFPPADLPEFMVEITLPDGAALSQTDKALHFVENALAAEPGIESVMSDLGRGNPRIYYNFTQREPASNVADAFAVLRAFVPGETPRLLDRLRTRFGSYPGAHIVLREFQNGPPIEAPVAVRVLGPKLEVLKLLSQKVETVLAATPGIRDIDNPMRVWRTDLQLQVDQGKAALLGVPSGAVDAALRLSLAGTPAGLFRDQRGKQFPITLRLPLDAHYNRDTLGRIYVPTATGNGIPLAQVASFAFDASPSRIDRYNRERSVTVTAFTGTGYNTAAVTAQVFRTLASVPLPHGYRFETGGEAQASSKSFAGIGNAAILSVFGILAVLILEFRSFRATLIVASVVPLGITGGILGLFVSGYTLSFTAAIGMIALVGIEIKNSILLVDFTHQLQDQGVALREAIERAGEIRFLPILLTSATAIGGLLPLALQGSGLYSPLACVIIGGLVTSTLMSRLVTPAVYLLLAPKDADRGNSP
jgi:multidrug efflux pump subunit AcrB